MIIECAIENGVAKLRRLATCQDKDNVLNGTEQPVYRRHEVLSVTEQKGKVYEWDSDRHFS